MELKSIPTHTGCFTLQLCCSPASSRRDSRSRAFQTSAPSRKPDPIRPKNVAANSTCQMRELSKKTVELQSERPGRGLLGESKVGGNMGRNCWGVVGLGQAMIDFGANVEEAELGMFEVDKGGRRVVNAQEQVELVGKLKGRYDIRAGSSVCNTLVGLSRLCSSDEEFPETFKYAMAGCIGSDMQGDIFREQLRRTGVEFLSPPVSGSVTGSVIVLTTPDAQRSFVAFPGSTEYRVDDALVTAISSAKVLLVEGYLLEMGGSFERLLEVVGVARKRGTIVALTAGDVGLVVRQRELFLKLMRAGVDILFANHGEAAALVEKEPGQVPPDRAAQLLAENCSLVAVTDGSRGSYLSALGRLQVVPPHWTKDPPVDTCGAGDAYAAGLLYGFLKGLDFHCMGQAASRAASAVISRFGCRLTHEDAMGVVLSMPRNVEDEVKVKIAQPLQIPSMGLGI